MQKIIIVVIVVLLLVGVGFVLSSSKNLKFLFSSVLTSSYRL